MVDTKSYMTQLHELAQELHRQDLVRESEAAAELDRVISDFRVTELAERITRWHVSRPIPDRWYPVQLGRLAAMLGASREQTAAALTHAGWRETRQGAASLWAPY